LRDQVQEALCDAIGDAACEACDPADLWKDAEVREEVRPVLADVGETAQFLNLKRMELNREASALFLDNLYDDLSAALRRGLQVSKGGYSPDRYPERFPAFEGADSGLTPWALFELWVSERKPAQSSIESWRSVFTAMAAQFKDRSAASIMPEEASAWIRDRVTKERSAATVKRTWLNASKTIFGWAVEHKHVKRNPFAGIKVTVPRKAQNRETRAFLPQEWRTILAASSAIKNPRTPDLRAKRWVPWLCAYTGARPGEITQLRGVDVIERDGIHAARLTPEAGTIKGGRARVVPLHPHLVAQGFLQFVKAQGKGPLFYKPVSLSAPTDAPTRQRKPRYSQARQRLAAWVRALGITDPELSPNHAWRHTFKQIADRVEISERMHDYITGHAHRSMGAGYGQPTLSDMAAAIKKFPRFEIGAVGSTKRYGRGKMPLR
jgi:integrase